MRDTLFPFQVRPHSNSWNLAGWVVYRRFPLYGTWAPMSRMYFTKWGARRAMRRMFIEFNRWEDQR